LHDIDTAVLTRITTISHVWPGITPMNVWDLTVQMWLIFAAAADDWNEQQRRSADG
jgi:hypothetical protein